MSDKDLIRALRGMAVETGSLVCQGCGYEHRCRKYGCAIINKAAARLQVLTEPLTPVRHGRWIGEGDGYAETGGGKMALVYDVWRCSECDYVIDDGTDEPEMLPNYCPDCGAKMDKEMRHETTDN